MNDLLERCCGLDVHKDTIVACVLDGPVNKTATSEIREFSTLIPDMQALKDWLVLLDCHYVAMESTGIYWQPIEVESIIAAEVEEFSSEMTLLCSIPGIAGTAAASIIAEIGVDMSRFKTAEHICSWAGLSPGNNESAGKKTNFGDQRQPIYQKYPL